MTLKPCPFCGASPYKKIRIVDDHFYFLHYVHCVACKCSTPKYESESEAAEAWNKRIEKVEE